MLHEIVLSVYQSCAYLPLTSSSGVSSTLSEVELATSALVLDGLCQSQGDGVEGETAVIEFRGALKQPRQRSQPRMSHNTKTAVAF